MVRVVPLEDHHGPVVRVVPLEDHHGPVIKVVVQWSRWCTGPVVKVVPSQEPGARGGGKGAIPPPPTFGLKGMDMPVAPPLNFGNH